MIFHRRTVCDFDEDFGCGIGVRVEIRIFAERRIFLKHVAPVGRGNFACNGIGERIFRMLGICDVVRARKKRFRLIARAARNIRNALLRGNASERIVEGNCLLYTSDAADD